MANERTCINCSSPMQMVKLTPADASFNTEIFTCIKCDNTEKIVKLDKSWLFVCSKDFSPHSTV